jgi:hypothetical protein
VVIHLATSGVLGGLAAGLVGGPVLIALLCLAGDALGAVGLAWDARRPPLTLEQLEHGGRFHNGRQIGE